MFVFVVVFVFASDGSINWQIVSLFVSVFASICMWISCCICVFIGQYMHFNQILYLCLYWPVLVFELVFVYVSVFASNCFWNFVYNNSVGQWWICWLYLIAEKSNKMCSFRCFGNLMNRLIMTDRFFSSSFFLSIVFLFSIVFYGSVGFQRGRRR